MERLDKILSKHGFGTRKDVKKLLHSGAVCVNGTVCTEADFHVDVDADVIAVDGETLSIKKNVYLMMNKKPDVVCAAKDGLHATVFDSLSDEYSHTFYWG